MNYAIELQGKTFTPDGVAEVGDVDAHNKALEAKELAAWAQKPDAWNVYVVERNGRQCVETWLGTTLGTMIRVHRFRLNMSRNMLSIRFRGTNGAVYYGRFGADWSQLCRVRKAKA